MSEDETDPSEGPLVRSLSMSRNMAYSVVDEVPHMIKLLPPKVPINEKRSWWKPSLLKKSSSTSSLPNIRRRFSAMELEQNERENSYLKSERRGSGGVDVVGHNGYQDRGDASKELKNSVITNSLREESSTQTLTPIVKGTRRNDLLVGIVVSRWDNIVGPQSVYLWTEELTSVFYPANLPAELSPLMKYVTDHTVDHQTATAGYIPPSVQRTTLCIVPDLNLAYLSLSIRVPTEIDTILEFQSSAPMSINHPDNPALTMPHSISVLCNLKYLNQFILLRPLVISWLTEFGPQIGVLLCKNNLHSSMINSWCAELCKTITALQTCWAQDTSGVEQNASQVEPHTKSSRFATKKQEKSERLETDISYLPPNSPVMTKSYLGSLLTSHLSTFGSSIVVGYDCLEVNKVIRFLLCFATSQEGYCSRYALATLPDTFMKGLFIQGLILGDIGERSISYKQVTANRLPLTRIELGSKAKVRHSSITTHNQEKDAITMQELNRLWTSSATIIQPTDPFPNVVKDVATFVSQFLRELELLPPESRYGRLLLFKRAIHAKAISLITFLHSIQHKTPKDKIKLKQLLPQILGFDPAEYLIVQVAAEKIRPGVMSLLIP
ncbi:Protein C9orf72 [Orchesella cincta]|uniref:Protein C9orf72 n=1 Tax=Orchesella cincta TaxID=48709 RepID=A0A1D2NDT6_ORCCI|nr:Protein C9orf72 [Orchesella cincta]